MGQIQPIHFQEKGINQCIALQFDNGPENQQMPAE